MNCAPTCTLLFGSATLLGVAACAVPDEFSSVDEFPSATWHAAASVEELGWSTPRVAALKGFVDSIGSSAFMIVTRGQIVAAWGDTGATFLSHSIRKSFMSALAGMAIAEGKLDTASTLAELGIGERSATLTPRELQARVADLLRARSGVYLAAAGEVEAMRAARPTRGSHAPGTFWYYNNWDFNVLGTIYRRATGEDIFQAIDARLAQPIQMQEYRPAEGQYYTEEPSEHPGYIFRISARDLARFGVLYLHRGRWRDKQLVPAAWVDASVRSYSSTGALGSRATKSGYGFMWWIQTNSSEYPELGIPNGTFTASGSGGQRLTVLPSIETVVVNLMNTDVPGPRIGSDAWDAILATVLAARLE